MKPDFDPLEAMEEHLRMMLNGGLGFTRSLKHDFKTGTEMKGAAGSYIW